MVTDTNAMPVGIIKALLGVVAQGTWDGIGVQGAAQLTGIVQAAEKWVKEQEEDAPVQEELELDAEVITDE